MRGRQTATLAVIVVLLAGAGLVVLQQRAGPSTASGASPTRVVSAAGDGAVVDPQTSTTAAPTGSPSTLAPTTTVAPPSSSVVKGATSGPAGAPATPGGRVPTSPPNPSSWSLDANGLSLRMRIEPAQPRVGDTVQFFLDATTTTSDWCCMNALYRGGAMLLRPQSAPPGPCPLAAGGEAQATYTPTTPGQIVFRFQASRGNICSPGFTFTTANLDATVSVNPTGS